MSLLKLAVLLTFFVTLTGCIDKSEELKLVELGNRVFLIENDTGNIYWVIDGKKRLVTDQSSFEYPVESQSIFEQDFSLPNHLYVKGLFRVRYSAVNYILELYDADHIKLQQGTNENDDKLSGASSPDLDSNANMKAEELLARLEDFNLILTDKDGFTVATHIVDFANSNYSTLTSPDGRGIGIRVEGIISSRNIDSTKVKSISRSYTGFTLDNS